MNFVWIYIYIYVCIYIYKDSKVTSDGQGTRIKQKLEYCVEIVYSQGDRRRRKIRGFILFNLRSKSLLNSNQSYLGRLLSERFISYCLHRKF